MQRKHFISIQGMLTATFSDARVAYCPEWYNNEPKTIKGEFGK